MTTKITCKKVEAGEYEYKGRTIYKADIHSNAYNPWRVNGYKYDFPTLKAAKQHIDSKGERQ